MTSLTKSASVPNTSKLMNKFGTDGVEIINIWASSDKPLSKRVIDTLLATGSLLLDVGRSFTDPSDVAALAAEFKEHRTEAIITTVDDGALPLLKALLEVLLPTS